MSQPDKSTDTDRDKDREGLRDMLLEIIRASPPRPRKAVVVGSGYIIVNGSDFLERDHS